MRRKTCISKPECFSSLLQVGYSRVWEREGEGMDVGEGIRENVNGWVEPGQEGEGLN